MSSDRHIPPEAVVDELFQLLTDERLAQSIDASIEQTAMAFEENSCQIASTRDLLRHLTRVTQVAIGATQGGRTIQEFEAREQTVQMLDQHYACGTAKGHDAAILAAVDSGEDALPDIIEALKIGLKTSLRSQHVRWAYSRLVNSRPWRERCAVAAACLDRVGHLLPEELLKMPPHRLEPVLLHLLSAHLESVGTLSGLLSH